MTTKIQWTDETWNPITGCTPISEGCQNCYAKKMSQRLKGRFGYPIDDPFKPGTMHPDVIHKPAHWKKPRRIFVCSMADIFHEDVDWNHLFTVWQMMGMNKRHTFIVLTKRPATALHHLAGNLGFHLRRQDWCDEWPLPNVWVGVTAENQQRADERILILLEIPAAVRFVSVEPMLGPVDIVKFMGGRAYKCKCGWHDTEHGLSPTVDHPYCLECGENVEINPTLDWCIVGAESGSGRRMCDIGWIGSIKRQCQETDTPLFIKQAHGPNREIIKMPTMDGQVWDQYPSKNSGDPC